MKTTAGASCGFACSIPAMGSGHFLLRACQFLAEDIATHPYSGEPDTDGRPDESAVTYWKRRVVECCLYGVDLNPMAVELAELAALEWFRRAKQTAQRDDFRPFHWELEFPEVFFVEGGRRRDAGFDAVIGNPPYDVLSERESGRNLAALRAFIDHDHGYQPSERGKNNLYKLFICRALDLLANGGYFSFITPMAVLGDDQAADLRRHMLSVGSFTGIEAFPQKDDPAKRVFPEAKLSTAVFAMRKDTPEAASQGGFRARVHPAATIDPGSPSLILTTAQIPLYDPANCGIVSCSQADWDLATRIMQTGRMTRLREFAEFFQGEVNETNERKRGTLAAGPGQGTLVNRGAGICLYVLRPESQGKRPVHRR